MAVDEIGYDPSLAWTVLPAILPALACFIFVAIVIKWIIAQDEGTDEMKKIAGSIRAGAKAFMMVEYKVIFTAIVIMSICILIFLPKEDDEEGVNYVLAIHFVSGSVMSALSGIIGMWVAIQANVRTTAAARDSINGALKVAFFSGTVMGLLVVSFVVSGQAFLYWIFEDKHSLSGYGLGASLVALFCRVGGGIFTKAADVGSDLVGKVEKGLPEDDPRNPATIADNVGDNVGDVAGLGSDLFESYVGAMVAAVPLGAARYDGHSGIALPFWIAGFGLAMCMIGTAFVRTKEKADQHTLLAALRWGVYGTSVLVLGTSAIACWTLFEGDEAASLYGCVLAGLISGLFVGYITEYATSDAYPPTQSIAKAADTGPATVIIQGLSVAMLSTIGPVVAVVLAVIISYELCGGYGVSIAATSMLSTLGMTLATDAYGPVADNAGGIAEMAKCAPETRKRTDALDSLGNTTAATGKGFAISSAALTTLSLITEFTSRLDMAHVDLLDVYVLSGVFIGCMLPFVLCAQTMRAVGKSAGSVILEVRRQLKEKPGIMDYTEEPDPARCVQLVTRAALQEMVQPALMTLGVPLVLGHLLGYYSLAGLLSGSIVAGFLLAVAFANAGGAWDNAKKLIESGALGPLRSKGTPAHDAAVCGDTVGDPMKDVSGPSIDILCKLMALFSLLLSPILTDDRSKWWIGVILLVVFLVIGVVITYVNEKFGPKTASFGDMIDEEGEKEEKKEETPAKDEEPVVVAEEEKKEDRA